MGKPAAKAAETSTPPKKSYAYLGKLDVQGWYAEITRLYKLSVDHNLGLHSADGNIILHHGAGGAQIVHIGGPYATFTININMPDADLVTEFERWLEEVRKQLKLPVAKPGQPSLNAKFDPKKFDAWRSTKIVEFADLLAWRATLPAHEQGEWKPAKLGRSIGRNSSKDVNMTTRILKQALASLPSLGAQVEHEMSQNQSARKAIATRIARDISR
jgi:hypothetical protein